jgi:hypothetical protein
MGIIGAEGATVFLFCAEGQDIQITYKRNIEEL